MKHMKGAVRRRALAALADNPAALRGADLRRADLSCAPLRGADLRGTRLGGASMQGADLREADLRGADLQGADLTCADLRGADLRGARLWGARWRLADLREVRYADGVRTPQELCGGAVVDGSAADRLAELCRALSCGGQAVRADDAGWRRSS